MSVWDAHAHFFSPRFYAALAAQVAQRRGIEYGAAELAEECEVEVPPSDDSLADRWRSELDAAGLDGSVLIASVPGDQDAVLAAAEGSGGRVLPYAMFHPTADGAGEQLARAAARGLRGVCLFPAMHQFDLHSEPVADFVGVAAEHGLVVFVHCGLLRVGLRDRLGLPSPFDLHRSNPLLVGRLAHKHPSTAFVIPHFGAGYFREALMLARQCDNVFLDTSSENRWTATQPGRPTLEEVFEQALEVVGAKRLLYGSDSSVFPRGYCRDRLERQREVLAKLLSDDEQAAVMGGNLLRIAGPDRD